MSGTGQTGGGSTRGRMSAGANRARTSWNPGNGGGGWNNAPGMTRQFGNRLGNMFPGIADAVKNVDWQNFSWDDVNFPDWVGGGGGGAGHQPRQQNPMWGGNWQGPAGQNPISQYYAHPDQFSSSPWMGRFMPQGPAPAAPWGPQDWINAYADSPIGNRLQRIGDRMDRVQERMGDPFDQALAHLRRRFPNAR